MHAWCVKETNSFLKKNRERRERERERRGKEKKENYTFTTTQRKGEELKNCMHGACKKQKKNPKPKMRERRSRKWSLKIKILKKRKKPSHYYWIFKDDDIPEVGRSHTPYFQFRPKKKKKSLMKLSHSPVDQMPNNF